MSQTDTNGTSVTVPLVGVNQVRDSRTSPMIDDIGGQTQEFLIDKSVRDFLDYETVQDTSVNDHLTTLKTPWTLGWVLCFSTRLQTR